MSYLTQSRAALWAIVVEGLEGDGFPYNPLTTNPNKYLATALGEPTAYLTKSPARMLSELITANGGGSYSHLTTPFNQLLEILGTTLSGGGGGEQYAADAVHFADGASLTGDSLSVTDSSTGILNVWLKADAGVLTDKIALIRGGDGNFMIDIASVGGAVNGFLCDFFSELGEDNFSIFGDVTSNITLGGWLNILMSWDMNYAVGSRRFAVYVNDTLVDVSAHYDEGGAAFVVDTTGTVTCLDVGMDASDFAEFGFWTGTTIVEADNTISEVNRRKFIGANGKPVDPSNWPASPLIKLSGDATGFIVNQGSSGAVTVVGDSPTNASTSPSD